MIQRLKYSFFLKHTHTGKTVSSGSARTWVRVLAACWGSGAQRRPSRTWAGPDTGRLTRAAACRRSLPLTNPPPSTDKPPGDTCHTATPCWSHTEIVSILSGQRKTWSLRSVTPKAGARLAVLGGGEAQQPGAERTPVLLAPVTESAVRKRFAMGKHVRKLATMPRLRIRTPPFTLRRFGREAARPAGRPAVRMRARPRSGAAGRTRIPTRRGRGWTAARWRRAHVGRSVSSEAM